MRKSKAIPLVLTTSVSAWALAACSDPAPKNQNVAAQPPKVYKTLAECKADSGNDPAACDRAFSGAVQAQAATAPHYTAKAQCEAEFGSGNCESRTNSEGGSFFMPAMMGFMVGQMLANRGGGSYAGQPVYINRGGEMFSGGRPLPTAVPVGGASTGAYAPARSTSATSSYNSTVSRGGFGATASRMGGCCG